MRPSSQAGCLAIAVCVLVICYASGSAVDRDRIDPFANWTEKVDMCSQNRCVDCVAQKECGFCATTWTCMYGNASGPQAVAPATPPLACPRNGTRSAWWFSHGVGAEDVCSYERHFNQVLNPANTPRIPLEFDTICVNGGMRNYALQDPDHPDLGYDGNSYCDCPDGWVGNECRSCANDAVCSVPNYPGNYSCSQQLMPSSGSLARSQRFSCQCTGAISSVLCDALGGGRAGATRIVVDVDYDNATATAAIKTPAARGTPNILYSPIAFWINFSKCEFTPDYGACPQGPEYAWNPANAGEPCARVECSVDDSTTPFPSWDNTPSCQPDETQACYPSSFGTCKPCVDYLCWDRSWRYKVCDGALESITSVYFMCQYNKVVGGSYECAFGTDGLGPIALQCSTGGCEFNSTGPPPAPPPIIPGAALALWEWDAIILSVPAVVAIAFATFCGVVLRRRRKDLEAHHKCATVLSDHAAGWLPAPIPPTVLSFHDVRFTIQPTRCSRPKPLLRGVSATVPSSLFALLGPSGAGKTTLLDIIAGRKSTAGGTWSGEVRINGEALSPDELRQCIGYVTQDDVMLGTQTVREYLLWQARMRLPSSFGPKHRHARVNSLLRELRLEHVASSKIGDSFIRGLSGGEKRRVSIAAALIEDPAIVVLDEPTSGLDSTNAKGLIDALARLARCGRVVILSIHQPRSYIWRQFDSILLLGCCGEVLYTGRRDRCIEFFDAHGLTCPPSYNPADFLLDMVVSLAPSRAREIEAACLSQQPAHMPPAGDVARRANSHELVVAQYRHHQAGFGKSVRELCVRTFTNVLRNPYLLALNYGATIVIGVVAGLIFNNLPYNFNGLQDRLGIFFFAFLFFAMTSLSSLGIWREERLLFLRERASHTYTTGPYFIAKVACDILPLRVLPPIVFSALVYWQAGLHDHPDNFIIFGVVITLVNLISAAVCLSVGALVRDLCLANLAASLVLLFQLLLCGLLSHNSSTGTTLSTFQRMSFMNYAFEILGNNEFIGETFNLSPTVPHHKVVPPFPATGETVVLTLGLRLGYFKEDIAALCAFAAAFTACVYVILRLCVVERR